MNKGQLIISRDTIEASRMALVDAIIQLDIQKELVLVCILKGAAYFAVDLSRDLEARGASGSHSVYFVEASSYKGQVQSDSIQILSKLVPEKLQDKHLLLLDELYDNGKTLDSIKTYLLAQNLNSTITTCVMFMKNKMDIVYPPPDLYGMMVPNVWLVGYGLDQDGKHRGLPDVYAIPKPKGVDWTPDDWRIFVNKDI